MKVFRIISAARCAVVDRYYITRGAKGKFPMGSENYYNILVRESGPSTHNPVKVAKNLYAAYQHNMQRINWADEMMNMDEQPSLATRIYHRLFKK